MSLHFRLQNRHPPNMNAHGIICETLTQVLYLDGPFSDQETFQDIGLDSLAMLELVMGIEERLNIIIDDNEIQSIKTIGEAVRFLEQKITKMKRIVFFDIESTGTDVVKDRIVSIVLKRATSIGGWIEDELDLMFNPGFKMSDEAIAIHGITNEMVADKPPFSEHADTIHRFVAGCDLGGFNLLNFDIPMLWEELYRTGIEWDVSSARVIDVGNIFKKKEERTLSAAVKFYCGTNHDSAHSAAGDVDAIIAVLDAQLARYPDLGAMDTDALARFSLFEDRIDIAGKLVRNKDGDPVYAFGKARGVRVKDDPGFAFWMLDKDFPTQTKICLRRILTEAGVSV